MKRKAFLNRMRNRRRGDQLEMREPERRRASDWRTLRVALPGEGTLEQPISIGAVELLATGIRLTPDRSCWVRGYRLWKDDEGQGRAEFQYRPVDTDDPPPPGAAALSAGSVWEPAAR